MGQGLEGNAPQWAPLNVEEGQAPTLTTPTVWRRRQREKEEQERRSSRREGAAGEKGQRVHTTSVQRSCVVQVRFIPRQVKPQPWSTSSPDMVVIKPGPS